MACVHNAFTTDHIKWKRELSDRKYNYGHMDCLSFSSTHERQMNDLRSAIKRTREINTHRTPTLYKQLDRVGLAALCMKMYTAQFSLVSFQAFLDDRQNRTEPTMYRLQK